jgi:hypothetical protein
MTSDRHNHSDTKQANCQIKYRLVHVMPGLVGVAGFHRRDDMHQAGTVAADDKHPGDDVLLADVVLGNVFDGNVY